MPDAPPSPLALSHLKDANFAEPGDNHQPSAISHQLSAWLTAEG
jgi:hypothetical protein